MKVIAERFYKEDFLSANGFSRQYVYKVRKAKLKKEQTIETIVSQVKSIRTKHKNMGSRVLFHQLQIDCVGINKFEKIISDYGLNIPSKRKRIVTTIGFYEKSDKNLINGLVLNNINQAIAGDITYLILKDKTYYIFTLKDMYSRRIIGLYASDTMMAANAIITLKQAIKLRGESINNCIHHTDAGTQYKSKAYKEVLTRNKIKMSIAENCLQNGMAEQLNGVLKNDYIVKEISSLKELNRQLTQIKQLINEERPVKELQYKTPVAYEQWLTTQVERPKQKLYDFTN